MPTTTPARRHAPHDEHALTVDPYRVTPCRA